MDRRLMDRRLMDRRLMDRCLPVEAHQTLDHQAGHQGLANLRDCLPPIRLAQPSLAGPVCLLEESKCWCLDQGCPHPSNNR